MTPIRRLISALVALWLRDNPHAEGEKWQVDENGVAVNVIIQKAKPEYVVSVENEVVTPAWSLN